MFVSGSDVNFRHVYVIEPGANRIINLYEIEITVDSPKVLTDSTLTLDFIGDGDTGESADNTPCATEDGGVCTCYRSVIRFGHPDWGYSAERKINGALSCTAANFVGWGLNSTNKEDDRFVPYLVTRQCECASLPSNGICQACLDVKNCKNYDYNVSGCAYEIATRSWFKACFECEAGFFLSRPHWNVKAIEIARAQDNTLRGYDAGTEQVPLYVC